MSLVFEICAVVVLVGFPLHLFYWWVLRPVCLANLRFKICRTRDQLVILGENAKDGKQAFPILFRKCDAALRCLDNVDLLLTLIRQVPQEIQIRIERDKAIIEDSPTELRQLNHRLESLMFGAALLNSPGVVVLNILFLPLAIAVLICCLAIYKAKSLSEALIRRLRASMYLSEMPATC